MSFEAEDLSLAGVALPPLVTGVLGLFVVAFLIHRIRAEKRGNELMEEISAAIQLGARTFLKLEYTAILSMVAILFILVSAAVNWRTGLCYLWGATSSLLCGYIGMTVSTYANVKTAAAAEIGLNRALRVAFTSGSVMGFTCVSVALISLSSLLLIFDTNSIGGVGALAGFGMGTSTVAIFARVGGGIFTKAADVGGDLVGKIGLGLPEDDVRNPATIADNVGDNVGDVAGMGADLYSSFCGSIVASALLGVKVAGNAGIALPFWICMSGLVAAVLGTLFVRCEEGASQHQLLNVLRFSLLVSGLLQIGFMAVIVHLLELSWRYFGCIVIGLTAGMIIGVTSEFFTSFAYKPTLSIANAARIGPANVIIQGLSVGMFSCVIPALVVASVAIATYNLANGTFGISLASVGLLSTLGITLATDAYGPVADNAGGIAEMAHMPAHTRNNTDVLDALGNTTAAIGKGFAVGSAVLTAFSLLVTFHSRVGFTIDPVLNDRFAAGLLVGAMVPYFFSALTMAAVNKAAQGVVVEVRRQWIEIPGLAEGTAKADYAKCVAMIMQYSLHAMVFPVLIPVLTPLIIGIGMGPHMLLGTVFGAIVSGFCLACMMSAGGGAWDNAKKYIESGNLGGKHSAAHHAAVVGDTIGDPFKDTSGPALNILIKLMAYISVVLASVFKNHDDYWWAALIIIGVLIVFVPVWMHFEPQDAVVDFTNREASTSPTPPEASGVGASPAAASKAASSGTGPVLASVGTSQGEEVQLTNRPRKGSSSQHGTEHVTFHIDDGEAQ